MPRVIQVHPDISGLIGMVTLEARPQGGPFSPQYYESKHLEKFRMNVKSLVHVHLRELDIPDFATMLDKAVAGRAAIAMRKPGSEDCNALPEKKDVKKAANVPPKKVSHRIAASFPPEKDTTEVTDDGTPEKVSPDSGV